MFVLNPQICEYFVPFQIQKNCNYTALLPTWRCEEFEFLDCYSASCSKALTPTPSVTPDLRKLIDSYSKFITALFITCFE